MGFEDILGFSGYHACLHIGRNTFCKSMKQHTKLQTLSKVAGNTTNISPRSCRFPNLMNPSLTIKKNNYVQLNKNWFMQTLFAMPEQNTIQWRKAHDINAKHQPSYTPSLAKENFDEYLFVLKKHKIRLISGKNYLSARWTMTCLRRAKTKGLLQH